MSNNIHFSKVVYLDPRAEGKQFKSGSLESAGYDISIFPRDEQGNPLDSVNIEPGCTVLVHTGVKLWIGANGLGNVFGMVVPRSSVGHKLNIMLGNTTGIIDADYQGELMLSLHNRSQVSDVTVYAGDRMAQIIFMPFLRSIQTAVLEFPGATQRGEGGYGSTGQ